MNSDESLSEKLSNFLRENGLCIIKADNKKAIASSQTKKGSAETGIIKIEEFIHSLKVSNIFTRRY